MTHVKRNLTVATTEADLTVTTVATNNTVTTTAVDTSVTNVARSHKTGIMGPVIDKTVSISSGEKEVITANDKLYVYPEDNSTKTRAAGTAKDIGAALGEITKRVSDTDSRMPGSRTIQLNGTLVVM